MNRLLALIILASSIPMIHAAPRLHALLFPDRTAAMLLVAALFYCGFKWRTR
jgi:hypothetical protein